MQKIIKIIKSIYKLMKYKPGALFIPLGIFASIYLFSLVYLIPILMGYRNNEVLSLLKNIVEVISMLAGFFFNLLFIKYIQLNLLDIDVTWETLQSTIKDKFLDVIIMNIKYGLIITVITYAMYFELNFILRWYRYSNLVHYPMIIAMLTSAIIAIIVTNRLSLYIEMTVLKEARGAHSIREVYKSTAKLWVELIPIGLIDLLLLLSPKVLKSLSIFNYFTYEKALSIVLISLGFKIVYLYFSTAYKVSCYTAYQVSVK